jgi:hypothetical protein
VEPLPDAVVPSRTPSRSPVPPPSHDDFGPSRPPPRSPPGRRPPDSHKSAPDLSELSDLTNPGSSALFSKGRTCQIPDKSAPNLLDF